VVGSRRYSRAWALVGLAVSIACAAAQAAAAASPTGAGTAAALAALARAGNDARSLDPDAVQRRYDVARDVEAGLAGVTPSGACRSLYDALLAVAHGSVGAAEGVDRPSEPTRLAGERRATAGLAAARRARAACPAGIRPAAGPRAEAARQPLLAPRDGEAFFGEVRLAVPPGTRRLEIRRRGQLVLRLDDPPARALDLRLPATSETGRGTLEVTLQGQDGTSRGRAERTWLLPRSAGRSMTRERPDSSLDARLARIAAAFPGYAGVYVHHMASGRTAGWNAGARFPAASTVKLGVLAAALDRFGPRPEQTTYLQDMQALAAWSSNLAANRLLRALGAGDEARGTRVVEATLRRLGARASTYPGDYRVGTSLSRSPLAPPAVSARTTSAADLGRMLTVLQAAAAGDRRAQSSSRLSEHEARLAIALLLDSEPAGDNAGLFRAWLPPGTPAAQKHGWISAARHSAAIVYGRRGPVVVVLLTYRDGLRLGEARELGRLMLRAALS
jgi:hypothetical protein